MTAYSGSLSKKAILLKKVIEQVIEHLQEGLGSIFFTTMTMEFLY
jgi:hypothetical protein